MNQKGQKGFVNILVVVLVVVVVVVAGYFALVEEPTTPVEKSSQEPVPSADGDKSFSLAADDTANWETYRNEEYGFELEYPPSWKLVNDISDPLTLFSFSTKMGREAHIRIFRWWPDYGRQNNVLIGDEVGTETSIVTCETMPLTLDPPTLPPHPCYVNFVFSSDSMTERSLYLSAGANLDDIDPVTFDHYADHNPYSFFGEDLITTVKEVLLTLRFF